ARTRPPAPPPLSSEIFQSLLEPPEDTLHPPTCLAAREPLEKQSFDLSLRLRLLVPSDEGANVFPPAADPTFGRPLIDVVPKVLRHVDVQRCHADHSSDAWLISSIA